MPGKAHTWEALGHVYLKKNDILESKKCFEKSLDHNPKSKISLRNLSMVYRKLTSNEDGTTLKKEQ